VGSYHFPLPSQSQTHIRQSCARATPLCLKKRVRSDHDGIRVASDIRDIDVDSLVSDEGMRPAERQEAVKIDQSIFIVHMILAREVFFIFFRQNTRPQAY
jgi:hypothetical protein